MFEDHGDNEPNHAIHSNLVNNTDRSSSRNHPSVGVLKL